MMNFFNFKEFNLDQMVDYPHILVVGKADNGKDLVVDNIMKYYAEKYDSVLSIVCPPDRMQSFYDSDYPNTEIRCGFQEEYLKKLLHEAMIAMSIGSEKNCMLVIDDCIDTTEFWDNKTVEEILMNGRHYKIPYILTMQNPARIPLEFVSTFDYIFVMNEESESNRKKIYDYYADVFPSRFAFEKIFTECTRENQAMVICRKESCDGLNKMIFWFEPKCDHDCVDAEYTPLIDLDNKEPDCIPAILEFIPPTSTELVPISRNPFTDMNVMLNTINESNTDAESVTGANDCEHTNNKSSVFINYTDENCTISLTTDNLHDSDAIMVLCDHVITLKNIRLEHMRLVNENMRLQIELNKYKQD